MEDLKVDSSPYTNGPYVLLRKGVKVMKDVAVAAISLERSVFIQLNLSSPLKDTNKNSQTRCIKYCVRAQKGTGKSVSCNMEFLFSSC